MHKLKHAFKMPFKGENLVKNFTFFFITFTVFSPVSPVISLATVKAQEAPSSYVQEAPVPETPSEPEPVVTTQEVQEPSSYPQDPEVPTYNIQPEITVPTTTALFGGEVPFQIDLKNTGTDAGYNASIVITLPKGFEFIKALPSIEDRANVDSPVCLEYTSCINPTEVNISSDGLQVLTYKSIADLLAGESKSIFLNLKVGGLAAGYNIGDKAKIDIKSTLYPQSDFSQGVDSTLQPELELKPFDVKTDSSSGDKTLVGETVDHTITIQNNPDVASSDPNPISYPTSYPTPDPFIVQYQMDSGSEYVDGSQRVENYDGNPLTIIFNIVGDGLQGLNTVLQWIFTDPVKTSQYLNPFAILFQTIVPKIDKNGDYVQHDQQTTATVDAQGTYTNPASYPTRYSETSTEGITAKYFTIEKWADQYTVQAGSKVTYTIQVKTSPEYNLSGIEITDVLPDGISPLQSPLINVSDGLQPPQLFANTYNSLTGETTLKWRLQALNPGTIYTFTYEANVNQNYVFKNDDGDSRILANDNLRSYVVLDGVWGDSSTPTRGGEGVDQDSVTNGLEVPVFTDGIKHTIDSEYTNQVDVRIGDKLDVYAKVVFPSSVPTKDFTFRTYLPVGTRLINGINVTTTGSFENNPTTITQVDGGYLFNLGKVEKGSSFELNYQLEVLDDANLKLATTIRNLFRGEYKNIDDQKSDYSNDVALFLIEPRLEVSKNLVSGYLARGEESEIQVKIKNTGTATAYNVSFEDQIPTNVTVIENSWNLISGSASYSYDSLNNKFVFDAFNLNPDQELILSYKVKTNSSVLYGDPVNSQVKINDFRNRDLEDINVVRIYESVTYNYNWQATEPLLATSLKRENAQLFSLPNSEIIVGRNDSFTLRGVIENVGRAPVYNNVISIDINTLALFTNDINSLNPKVYIDGILVDAATYTVSVNSGIYQISGLTINPYQFLSVEFDLITPKFIAFDQTYPVTIMVVGDDNLNNDIRKDGSAQTYNDYDADDQSTFNIKTSKIDTTNPYGEIRFKDNGTLIAFTNKNLVDVEYTAFDLPAINSVTGEIIGVQFSDDNSNWTINSNLSELDDSTKSALGITGSWNSWDGSQLTINGLSLTVEGENYKYMRIVDLYGNIATINRSVIYDITPPEFANVLISPFINDLTNPQYSGTFTNYVMFGAIDNIGVGYYSYSTDGINWSEWSLMNEGLNTMQVTFPSVAENEDMVIYLKVKDLAGNELLAPNFVMDTITYSPKAPVVSVNLNSGDAYTNSSLVNLGLNITDSPSGAVKIRFGKDASDILNRSFITYNSSVTQSILIDAFNTGSHMLCVQVQDAAGNLSNTGCDSILLDTTAPAGSLKINNGSLQTTDPAVTLTLTATDANLFDGSAGVGGIMYRISETGNTSDDSAWSTWSTLVPTIPYTLHPMVGEQLVYVQYKDALNNTSQAIQASIVLNPFFSTGNIKINNDAVFTNTNLVNLNLDVDVPLNTQNSNPILMRFIQTNDAAVPIAPTSNDTHGDGRMSGLPASGWTYWYTYNQDYQWNLDQGNSGTPNYGKKNVYVQYMLPNGDVTAMYSDSIIYAPYYGIKYQSISNIPTDVYTQDQFSVTLKVQNTGSFTWPKDGNNPVHISYTLKQISSANPGVPSGSMGTSSLVEYRGNSAILPQNISWNQESGELTLIVDTPQKPGRYLMTIDTIHEGVAWFSSYANEKLVYQLDVTQNPNKPPITDPEPETLGANTGGYDVGYNFNIVGEWLQDDEGYDYMIIMNGVKYHFLSVWGGDEYLLHRVIANVTATGEGWDYHINWVRFEPWSWIAANYSNNYTNPIHIYRGETKNIIMYFVNNGTAKWKNDTTYIQRVSGDSSFSPFSVAMDQTDYVANGNTGSFRFSITALSDKSEGQYTVCYRPGRNYWESSGLMDGSNTMCMNIQVELTDAEKRAYRCEQPQNVYINHDKSSQVIGTLDKDSEFVQVGTYIDTTTNPSLNWIRVYYPTGNNQQGWIENSDSCFENITSIPNPISSTPLTVPPRPTDDNGFIIAVEGIDIKLGPSQSFPTIGHLYYGEHVQVLAHTNTQDRFGGWLKIRKDDGTEGWIPDGFVDHVNTPQNVDFNLKPQYSRYYTCGGSVDTRTGPGTQYPVNGQLSSYKNIRILLQYENWYLTYRDTQGNTGWIPKTGLCQGIYYPQPTYSGSVNGQSFYNGVSYIRPLDNYIITQNYSNPNGNHIHGATDYAQVCGTAVKAAADGVVARVVKGNTQHGTDPIYWSYANYVYIDHPNGTRTAYVHLGDVYVNVGQYVKQGQVIGNIGLTGMTSGCHLHFELWNNKDDSSSKIDPESKVNLPISGAEAYILKRQLQLFDYQVVNNNLGVVHEACGAWLKDYQMIKETSDDGWPSYGNIIFNPKTLAAYVVRGDIRSAYWDKYQGTCGVLGLPQSDDLWAATSPQGTSGAYQNFDNGKIYSSRFGTYAVYGEIGKMYELAGGTRSNWGFPMGDQKPNSEGVMCQKFEGGTLCLNVSPSSNSIISKESQFGNINASSKVYQWCGTERKDYYQLGSYSNGASIIYNPNDQKSYVLTGGIGYSYWTYGGCDRFGLPTMDAAETGKVAGWYQNFEKATIYWARDNSKSQPGIVEGDIKNYYHSLGGTWSDLGFPEGTQSSGVSLKCNSTTTGTHQNFNGGKIYSSSAGTIDMPWNNWLNHYIWSMGEMQGELGWPRTKNFYNNKGVEVMYFEAGELIGKRTFAHWYIDKNIFGCNGMSNDQIIQTFVKDLKGGIIKGNFVDSLGFVIGVVIGVVDYFADILAFLSDLQLRILFPWDKIISFVTNNQIILPSAVEVKKALLIYLFGLGDEYFYYDQQTIIDSFLPGLSNAGNISSDLYTPIEKGYLVAKTVGDIVTLITLVKAIASIGKSIISIIKNGGTTAAGELGSLTNAVDDLGRSLGETGDDMFKIKPYTAMGEMYPMTSFPKAFSFTATNGKKIAVIESATDHIPELLVRNVSSVENPAKLTDFSSKLVMEDLQFAIDDVVSRPGFSVGNMYYSGNWELRFSSPQTIEGVDYILHHALLHN